MQSGGAVAYLFLLPSLVFLAVFTLWPIVSVLWGSFHARRGRSQIFVGTDNFERILFSDPFSQQVILNTRSVYVTLSLLMSVFGGLLLAILMNQGLQEYRLLSLPLPGDHRHANGQRRFHLAVYVQPARGLTERYPWRLGSSALQLAERP